MELKNLIGLLTLKFIERNWYVKKKKLGTRFAVQ